MDSERLFLCHGDSTTYIKHLELRVLYLQRKRDTSLPDSQQSQQWTGAQSSPCDVCRAPNRYTQVAIPGDFVTTANLNNQSSLNETSGNNLRIQFWQPKGNSGKSVAARRIDAVDLSEVYSKFQSLFKSEKWKVLFSYNESRRQEIVRHLISGLVPLKSKSPSVLSSNPLISALHRYSESMKATTLDQETKPKNRPFACFRELIFCSMCAVARMTTKSEIVYDIMRSVYGSDACSGRFRALIRGAKWANEAIYHLSLTKCGKRSWDIVYTSKRLIQKPCSRC